MDKKYPYLKVKLTRFSSAVGYGYESMAYFVTADDKEFLFCAKCLHCVYGETSSLSNWQTSIKPRTLMVLEDLCRANGSIWGVTIFQEMSWETYRAKWAGVASGAQRGLKKSEPEEEKCLFCHEYDCRCADYDR